jgi:hypothetical protein
MIDEFLEIWQRRILSHCHVNNQPGGVATEPDLVKGASNSDAFLVF